MLSTDRDVYHGIYLKLATSVTGCAPSHVKHMQVYDVRPSERKAGNEVTIKWNAQTHA